MNQARCTLDVEGLDCPKEVDSLSAALRGQPGVNGLGFDLIHGTMTVDYDEAESSPERPRAAGARVRGHAGVDRGSDRAIGAFVVVAL